MELQTDDLTLHYEDDGDPEAPPILILHGITPVSYTHLTLPTNREV